MADDIPDNPRLITFAEAQQRYGGGSGGNSIDLGVVNAADAYREGIKILLPVVPGRIITGVRFLSDNFATDNNSGVFFGSGNDVSGDQGAGDGFAKFGQQNIDTIGIAGGNGSCMRCDGGPLGLVTSVTYGGLPRIWTPDTLYAKDDWVLKSDHIQLANSGGRSGATEPTWPTDGGTVSDGEDGLEWRDAFDISSATATVHAIAEVTTIPDLVIPYPASLEWIQQPTDVVAGQAFDPEIAIQMLDQNGNPFTNANTLATSAYGYVLGAGAFNVGASPINMDTDASTGIISYSGLGMDAGTPAGTYQLVIQFRYDQLTVSLRIDSDPFDVTAP